MKTLTETIDDFYKAVKSMRVEDAVEHLLRKTAMYDQVVAFEALIRLLVICYTRARLAEAENSELKRRLHEIEKINQTERIPEDI